MQSKDEKKFLIKLKKFEDHIYSPGDNAVMEGFEYYTTEEYKRKPGAITSRPKQLVTNQKPYDIIRLGVHMSKRMPSMIGNIKKNYTNMDDYIHALQNNTKPPHTPNSIIKSYPNNDIWNDLCTYAWDKHKVIVGFTEVSQEYIFKGKAIPFKYALVFAQQMKKEAIEKAPKLDAGMEVVNVYNSLGIATNDILKYLKDKYNIVGMANHPLGGLIDFIPLAQKAGLGEIGRNGMLITKEFGPRCRISPILIDEKLFEFTDNKEHEWIKKFCSKCGSCFRSCQTSAIYEEAKLVSKSYSKNTNDRYSSFDREKCFTSFSATMGCAVCISVCPFSKNPNIYDKMKLKYL